MYIDIKILIRLTLTLFVVYNVWIGTKWAVPIAISWLFLQTELAGYILSVIYEALFETEETTPEE